MDKRFTSGRVGQRTSCSQETTRTRVWPPLVRTKWRRSPRLGVQRTSRFCLPQAQWSWVKPSQRSQTLLPKMRSKSHTITIRQCNRLTTGALLQPHTTAPSLLTAAASLITAANTFLAFRSHHPVWTSTRLDHGTRSIKNLTLVTVADHHYLQRKDQEPHTAVIHRPCPIIDCQVGLLSRRSSPSLGTTLSSRLKLQGSFQMLATCLVAPRLPFLALDSEVSFKLH